MPAETILQWWRGHPAGWWNPADWNVASICVPIATHVPHAAGLAWGKKLRGEDAGRDGVLRRRRDERGRVPRGRQLRGRHGRAGRSSSATTTAGRSRRRSRRRRAPSRSPTRRSATASRACASTALDVLAVFEATREAVERARAGGGPTLHRGGALPRRAARDGRRSEARTSISQRVEEERARECLGRFERLPARLGVLNDERAEAAREAAELMRAGHRRRRGRAARRPGAALRERLRRSAAGTCARG